MPWENPSSAVLSSIRPLNKGMMLDVPSNLIADGGVVEAMNFIANKEGYRRRPGWDAFAAASTIPYRILAISAVKDDLGVYQVVLLTDTSLYIVDPIASFTEVPWAYDTGTVTVSGSTVTGLGGTVWENDILPGDLLRIGTNEARVLLVNSNTDITIDNGALPDVTSSAYSIQRTFTDGMYGIPQWTSTPDGVAIADGKHELLWYKEATNEIVNWITTAGTQPPDGPSIPCAVGYADDRVFIGYLSDDDGVDPQKIRWSGIADIHDFNFSTNYNILPRTMGSIVKFMTLQDSFMVYMQYGIFFGMPTGLATYPFAWRSMETGNAGLVGPYAITAYLGGHFLIAQTGFYYVDSSNVGTVKLPELKEISQAIKPLLDYNTWDQQYAYVCKDTVNNSILFGIAADSEAKIKIVWRLDPRSSSWSYDELESECLLDAPIAYRFPWTALSVFTWNDIELTYPTWISMDIGKTAVAVLVENSHALWRNGLNNATDFVTNPILARLVTKDHDFDVPDMTKTITRFSIKIHEDTERLVPVQMTLRGSVNMGRTYVNLGVLVIPVGYDEGYVNFRLSGSTLRFELSTTTENDTYTIIEYALRVRGLGEELNARLQT